MKRLFIYIYKIKMIYKKNEILGAHEGQRLPNGVTPDQHRRVLSPDGLDKLPVVTKEPVENSLG